MSLTPELTRRGFIGALGASLALVGAPAIVRASSLIPVLAARRLEDYVREVWAYDINNDGYRLRFDLAVGDHQLTGPSLFIAASYGWRPAAMSEALVSRFRQQASAAFRSHMREQNLSSRLLRHLPLPEGVYLARRGISEV